MEGTMSSPSVDYELLSRFFHRFRLLSPPVAGAPDQAASLSRFFTTFRELRSRGNVDANDLSQPTSAPDFDLSVFFEEFRPLHDKALRRGDFINVWDVAGLGRDELRNAAVLSWVLDCSGSHGAGSAPLVAFFRRLAQNHPQFPLPLTIDNRYWTRTESYPLANTANRVDIEIHSPDFLAFIEVKIDAPEGDRQIARYVELAEEKALGPYAVIFLTRNAKRRSSVISDRVVNATWKDVAAAIDDVVSTFDDPRGFSRQLLAQFSHHVSQL